MITINEDLMADVISHQSKYYIPALIVVMNSDSTSCVITQDVGNVDSPDSPLAQEFTSKPMSVLALGVAASHWADGTGVAKSNTIYADQTYIVRGVAIKETVELHELDREFMLSVMDDVKDMTIVGLRDCNSVANLVKFFKESNTDLTSLELVSAMILATNLVNVKIVETEGRMLHAVEINNYVK